MDCRLAWDEDRVALTDENGELVSLPAAWTDVDPVEPFVTMAAGRCPFRVSDLLAAAELIEALRAGVAGMMPQPSPDPCRGRRSG